jgi:hypothetical protein
MVTVWVGLWVGATTSLPPLAHPASPTDNIVAKLKIVTLAKITVFLLNVFCMLISRDEPTL